MMVPITETLLNCYQGYSHQLKPFGLPSQSTCAHAVNDYRADETLGSIAAYEL